MYCSILLPFLYSTDHLDNFLYVQHKWLLIVQHTQIMNTNLIVFCQLIKILLWCLPLHINVCEANIHNKILQKHYYTNIRMNMIFV